MLPIMEIAIKEKRKNDQTNLVTPSQNKKVDNYDPDVTVDGNHLIINNVNRSHSGRYRCLAEDGSQTPAMEAITVIVHCE